MNFPRSFLFGTATAATQIEGGCTTSDWLRFSREPGRVKNGDTPALACGSFLQWRRDIKLQVELGMNAYRMSIEWARLEPKPGLIDHKAIERYRQILGGLRDAGIEPMVTLHHFTLPTWLADKGGILADDFVERFARFAQIASSVFADLCHMWITINEPSILAGQSYLRGVWPPAQKSVRLAWLAQRRMLAAHKAAYRVIKRVQGHAAVGIAHHLRAIEPERPLRRDSAIAGLFAVALHDRFVMAAIHQECQDFLGINYYGRDRIRFSLGNPGQLFCRRSIPDDAPVSDLGWEIYPQGLRDVLNLWDTRSQLPIYITENGLADADDSRRAAFIRDHLTAVASAIADGVDVRGYYHWSLLDNFEWAEGYTPRFGLAHVDYDTGERTLRPSAHVYARIARERRI